MKVKQSLARATSLLQKSLGFLIVFAACAGSAQAISQVPEVDPAFAGNAVALVVGGLLLLTGLRRKR